MTESIKQEIINNIFENGDKLITGPILQTVLIDMIDDVNVKDQAILSKTGSWDEAVTQIPNLATKAEVTNLSESIARDLENVVDVDLTGYATEQWVESQGYLKEHQDISGLATKTELTQAENTLQGNITSLSESVARDLANVSVPEGVATEQWVQSQDYASKSYVDSAVSSSSVDLTGYATETWVESQGYLKEHQDLSDYATKVYVNEAKSTLESNLNNLSSSVSNDIQNKGEEVKTWVQNQGYLTEHQDISNLATKGELNDTKNNLQGNITSLSESVARDLANVDVDLTGYATETWVESQGYLKEHQDISGLATKTELTSVSESVQTDISNLSESVANSAVWKKGEGQDSLVKVLTGDNETNTPTATGYAAIATGYSTHATGWNSHAEGQDTSANNYNSHAEGRGTIATNVAEHAEGTYNHNSENQIFSIGAGGDENGSLTRRNAVSVLVVPNSETQINTASFFVQNIGGYDGTNPEPGTNDLATVINGMSTGGGSSETLWKKGTGKDSIVQVLTGDDETKTPKATGTGSIATGKDTTASGDYSHAEGSGTKALGKFGSHAEGRDTEASGWSSHAEGRITVASGEYSHVEGSGTKASGIASHAEGGFTTAQKSYSHAEGYRTEASGQGSHTEGDHTIASNDYEHAQGRYNYTSSNQIFSIGTGNSDTDRRNAVSVLEVDNSGSYTSSVFVQNIGGYDGTNPTPGTNDLATVINGLSSSGGSSETLWKKGTGTDSVVQKVTSISLTEPIASGVGAAAIGDKTKASGWSSHAEGGWTEAQGNRSHAEGSHTRATGEGSHAEGYFAVASNNYEHAQGLWNHTSSNQIFSIGAGDGDPSNPETATRRNAISVLAVDSSGSYTSSFFVQNIGGYDGTNPEPGTNDLATVINGLSSGGGSSETLWKKGEGEDSIVQKLTGANETNTPKASGTGSIATGKDTTASGDYSHAEGSNTKASGGVSHAEGEYTKASGIGSHAEGDFTIASGQASHAEGLYTIASNKYEHAQGRYNYTSSNQIFSVGAGDYGSRRNAVSVLVVSNNNSNTGSFFVQNIGGYDGTNPTPGTNDLATVLNNTETWTFTLEDGSTVTKNIIIA